MAIILCNKIYSIDDEYSITDCSQAEADKWKLIIRLLKSNKSKVKFSIYNELNNTWIEVRIKDLQFDFQINIGPNYICACYYIAEDGHYADSDYETFEEFEKEFNQYVSTGKLDWF